MYYTSSPISNKLNRIAGPSHTKTVRHYKSASKAPAAASAQLRCVLGEDFLRKTSVISRTRLNELHPYMAY